MKKILLLFLALGVAVSNAMVHPNQQLAPIQEITQQLTMLEQKPQASNLITKTKIQKIVELLKANPILATYFGALAAGYVIWTLDFCIGQVANKKGWKSLQRIRYAQPIVQKENNFGENENDWNPCVASNWLEDRTWNDKEGLTIDRKHYLRHTIEGFVAVFFPALVQIQMKIGNMENQKLAQKIRMLSKGHLFALFFIQVVIALFIIVVTSGVDYLIAKNIYKDNPEILNKNLLIAFYNWIKSKKQAMQIANSGRIEQKIIAVTK